MEPPDSAPESPQHYFSARPRVASRPEEHRFLYRGEMLVIQTDRGLFASHGLDPGTALLIETLETIAGERVLDLGCGWGAIGLAAAKTAPSATVVLTDVNQRAVRLARKNLDRNGVRNAEVCLGSLFEPVADGRFDLILSHPPFHAGREMVLRLLTEAPDHLTPSGRLRIVGKGSQGIRFYQAWLAEHWGPNVEVLARGGGYRVIEATPRSANRQR
ncbi:MAG TPA: methyltransferase [Thermoplasmata archaeon]|nr:methyltransferase [Thermoplasmata archaeon]